MAIDTQRTVRDDVDVEFALLAPASERRLGEALSSSDETPAWRRDSIFRHSLVAADVVALAVAAVVAIGGHMRPGLVALAALMVLTAKTMSLYDRDQAVVAKRTLDDTPDLFQLATFLTLVFWLGQGVFTSQHQTSRTVMMLWAVLFLALLLCRGLGRAFAQRVAPAERCLVIAEADDHRRIDDKLSRDGRLRSQVVAHLPLFERRLESDEPPHSAMERCVRTFGIHRVVVAPEGAEPGVVLDVVSRAKALGVNVSVLPRVCEVVGSAVQFDDLGGLTLLGVRSFRLSRSTLVIKRAVDVVGAALGLVLGAPLLAVVAVAIKLDSRGPLFFRQTRVGRDGAPFEMLKFRSMVVGAHDQRPALAEASTGAGLFKLPVDPRVTRVGRFLRATSLDELPQIVNVLRGQMSLVGPRPLILEEDALVLGPHRRRLHLKPGLTGPWQVLGSPDVRVGIEEMATIDYLYTVNWSLWADMQVILRTIVYVLARRGV